MIFDTSFGSVYWILVHGYNNSEILSWKKCSHPSTRSPTLAPVQPSGGNGQWQNAVQIPPPPLVQQAVPLLELLSITMLGTFPVKFQTPPSAPGVWYRLPGTGETLTAHLCDDIMEYNTHLSVFGRSFNMDPSFCVRYHNDTCGLRSSVTF